MTATCLSPFNQLTGEQLKLQRFEHQPPDLMLGARARACSAATNKREHALDALAIGAIIIIIALPFLPRRRPAVTVSVNPQVL